MAAKTKGFDGARLAQMVEPITLRVERKRGPGHPWEGVPLVPFAEGVPPGVIPKESISELEGFLVRQAGGGEPYKVQFTDANGQAMEHEFSLPISTYGVKTPEALADMAAPPQPPQQQTMPPQYAQPQYAAPVYQQPRGPYGAPPRAPMPPEMAYGAGFNGWWGYPQAQAQQPPPWAWMPPANDTLREKLEAAEKARVESDHRGERERAEAAHRAEMAELKRSMEALTAAQQQRREGPDPETQRRLDEAERRAADEQRRREEAERRADAKARDDALLAQMAADRRAADDRLAQLLARIDAKPTGPDPFLLALMDSQKVQAQAMADSAKLRAEADREASRAQAESAKAAAAANIEIAREQARAQDALATRLLAAQESNPLRGAMSEVVSVVGQTARMQNEIFTSAMQAAGAGGGGAFAAAIPMIQGGVDGIIGVWKDHIRMKNNENMAHSRVALAERGVGVEAPQSRQQPQQRALPPPQSQPAPGAMGGPRLAPSGGPPAPAANAPPANVTPIRPAESEPWGPAWSAVQQLRNMAARMQPMQIVQYVAGAVKQYGQFSDQVPAIGALFDNPEAFFDLLLPAAPPEFRAECARIAVETLLAAQEPDGTQPEGGAS